MAIHLKCILDKRDDMKENINNCNLEIITNADQIDERSAHGWECPVWFSKDILWILEEEKKEGNLFCVRRERFL